MEKDTKKGLATILHAFAVTGISLAIAAQVVGFGNAVKVVAIEGAVGLSLGVLGLLYKAAQS